MIASYYGREVMLIRYSFNECCDVLLGKAGLAVPLALPSGVQKMVPSIRRRPRRLIMGPKICASVFGTATIAINAMAETDKRSESLKQ